jgi:hypothetical protein
MEFYHQGRGILARQSAEAPSPAVALLMGRDALLAEHPSPPGPRRRDLFARAQRAGGNDESGWVLYRIARDDGRGLAGEGRREAGRPPATENPT